MKILINGDSNMCGEELVDKSLSIGSQLCKMLGGEEINLAKSGASNDRIYDTTMEYIRTNPAPDLIVVGWSEMCRVQWFTTLENTQVPEWHDINGIGVGQGEFPVRSAKRLENWKDFVRSGKANNPLGYYWHERVYNLHKYLEYNSIPHVFFHAFDCFPINQVEYQLNWSNRFMNPYTGQDAYVRWCASEGFKEITPGWYHYEEEGQLAWANRIYDYINKHNLLTYDHPD